MRCSGSSVTIAFFQSLVYAAAEPRAARLALAVLRADPHHLDIEQLFDGPPHVVPSSPARLTSNAYSLCRVERCMPFSVTSGRRIT